MAKDLPYFKFFCSEWNDGDITLEDYEVQGLFINLCSYYWSNECDLLFAKAEKKFRNAPEDLWQTLLDAEIIQSIDGKLVIKFLDEQKEERQAKSITNRENGKKGGRPKKPKESEINPIGFDSVSESKAKQKALREEKRREEKKRKENSIPSFEDFKSHSDSKDLDVNQTKLKLKYDSWVENGWKDGNGNDIVGWKAKLTNTLPYLLNEKPMAINNQPKAMKRTW